MKQGSDADRRGGAVAAVGLSGRAPRWPARKRRRGLPRAGGPASATGRRRARGQRRHRGRRQRRRGGGGRDLHDVLAPTEGRVAGTTDLVRAQRASGSARRRRLRLHRDHRARGSRRAAHAARGATRSDRRLDPGGARPVLDGRIVGIDLETDLAVVKVEATGLPTLSFGDSDDLRAGQFVIALGSPLGFYNSVSLGVVSAVARQLEPESPMVYVQSDAAISSGSSGGPLVDLRGRIVGINTLVASREGAAGEGLGFAAPSNIVRGVYEQIRQHGRVRRGDIGVRPQTLTPMLATGLGLARDYGVVLADVLPGGPAAQAGLRPATSSSR